jgi:hypothetical protein
LPLRQLESPRASFISEDLTGLGGVLAIERGDFFSGEIT